MIKLFGFFMISEEAKGVDETEETSINAESIEILKIHRFFVVGSVIELKTI